VIEAALVLGGIGVIAGLGLGAASRVFAVRVDSRLAEITEALPGTDCGACGYPGCAAAAEAVVEGEAGPDVCVVGEPEVARAVAEAMGAGAGKGGGA